MKINAPCKDCQKRYLACHDHCDIFAEYKKKNAEEKAAKDNAMKTTYYKRAKLPSTYIKAKHYYRNG